MLKLVHVLGELAWHYGRTRPSYYHRVNRLIEALPSRLQWGARGGLLWSYADSLETWQHYVAAEFALRSVLYVQVGRAAAPSPRARRTSPRARCGRKLAVRNLGCLEPPRIPDRR